MYKVFDQDKCLFFVDKNEDRNSFPKDALTCELSSKKSDQKFKGRLNKHTSESIMFVCEDLKTSWKEFKEDYKIIEAAGGLVTNESGETLFIFRNDKWDLPKGKVEKDENIEVAAKREVVEECGIQSPQLIKLLTVTYHTYELNGKNILKKTYWYEMKTKDKSVLTPQLNEGITLVKWMLGTEINEAIKNTYPAIKDVLKSGGKI